MATNKQTISVNAPTVDQLKLQILQMKSRFGDGFRYMDIYQYFFGNLDSSGKNHLRDVWNTKATDKKINDRLEWIFENRNQAPTFNTDNK